MIVVNAVTYFHAWRLTHYVPEGERTRNPRELSTAEKIFVLARGVEIPKPANDAPPSGGRTVRLTARDGVNLEAWALPAASNETVVVMFHGHASSKSALRGEAAMFRELGLATVLVDFRGSGGSDGAATTLGWEESADVAAAMTWTRGQWPEAKLLLYGQSMGSAAVLRAVATENVEQPDGLILETPYDTLLQTVSHRYDAMRLPSFPFAQMLVFWGGVQHGFNAFAMRPAEYARAVRCPSLLIGGENDTYVRPSDLQRVAGAMSGPTQCHIFAGIGHGGFYRRANTEYRHLTQKWLADCLNPRRAL
jgi:alpha-beta hydrolase superfamily lysophospholipase